MIRPRHITPASGFVGCLIVGGALRARSYSRHQPTPLEGGVILDGCTPARFEANLFASGTVYALAVLHSVFISHCPLTPLTIGQPSGINVMVNYVLWEGNRGTAGASRRPCDTIIGSSARPTLARPFGLGGGGLQKLITCHARFGRRALQLLLRELCCGNPHQDEEHDMPGRGHRFGGRNAEAKLLSQPGLKRKMTT